MTRKKQKSSGAESRYTFRPGSRVSGVTAEVAGTELERIRATSGELTPPLVVEAARSEGSPLHGAFEWDDAAAACEHRLWQARSLIRAVCVRYADGGTPAPMYVRVSSEEAAAYHPVEVVVHDVDLFAAALEPLIEKLAMAQHSVDQLRRAARMSGQAQRASKVEEVGRHIEAAVSAAKVV